MGRQKNTLNETEVLVTSKRRCCLCAGLNGDYSEKLGQIAHLDRNKNNNSPDNLAFLCLEHHSQYDSTTSQHKNYTKQEAKYYRNKLYVFIEKNPQIGQKGGKPISEIDRPNVLLFDGADETAIYQHSDIENIKEFTITGECAIENGNYGGSIFSINEGKYEPLVYLRYFPIDHDKYPGEAIMVVKDPSSKVREVKTGCLVSNMRWIVFNLTYKDKKLSLKINDQKTHYLINLDPTITSIQIAGRGVDGRMVGDNLNCYFTYFKFLNLEKDEVLFNYIFEHGKEYFDSLPKSKHLELINMEDADFYKTENRQSVYKNY